MTELQCSFYESENLTSLALIIQTLRNLEGVFHANLVRITALISAVSV